MRTLGRMRGRACTQPFLVEKRRSPDCRLNEVFLLLRWACRSPPHQSPSVTASPQGEASGLCRPTQKKRSKSGYADGHRNSPTTGTMRPTTPKRASGNERAIKKGGAGGIPPRLFSSGLSLEKAWIPRPGPGGNPPRRCQPAPVSTGPPADGNPGRAPQRALSTRTSPVGRPTVPWPKNGHSVFPESLLSCHLTAFCSKKQANPGNLISDGCR